VPATDALLLAANDSLLSREGILLILGGAAGLLAILGLLLLLPLYLTQRAEVERLLHWMDREPEAGTTEFRAVTPPGMAPRTSGRMTPAERVTSERPALARISTAEHDALVLKDAPLWRRVLDRGPRHPLVVTVLALIVAVAIFVAAGLLIRSDDGGGDGGGGIDRGDIQIAVVNSAGTSGVADQVGDGLSDRGFDVVSNDVGSDTVGKTKVQYAKGQKRAGNLVVGTLDLQTPAAEFDAEGEAAADGADVVIFVGGDLKPAEDGDG
jgi:hypothetical protein